MFYEDVFGELYRRGIQYLVTGGVAVNIHGYARLTMDLDIMLELEKSNLSKFVETMETLGYGPRVPVNARDVVSAEKRKEWMREKKAVVFTFVHARQQYKQIDIFLENPVKFSDAYAARHVITVNHIPVPVVSIADLISMKKKADRPRDQEDIIHLERIQEMKGKHPHES